MPHNSGWAVVTGSSRGIGLATAVALGSAGWSVILNGRGDGADVLQGLHERHDTRDGQFWYVQADVATPEGRSHLVAKVSEIASEISVLVNNVGSIANAEGWAETGIDEVEADLKSNFLSALGCIQLFLPLLEASSRARIINISSIYGDVPAGPVAAYGAAKAAVSSLTKSVAIDLAPKGILVNSVSPGNIDTDMTNSGGAEYVEWVVSKTPVGRLGRAEEVATAVLFLAESDFITGHDLVVDGGISLIGG